MFWMEAKVPQNAKNHQRYAESCRLVVEGKIIIG
jgi:hypothetical protein